MSHARQSSFLHSPQALDPFESSGRDCGTRSLARPRPSCCRVKTAEDAEQVRPLSPTLRRGGNPLSPLRSRGGAEKAETRGSDQKRLKPQLSHAAHRLPPLLLEQDAN